MSVERCVASHYEHDCSKPAECRRWLTVMLSNVDEREQRADLDREEQARAEVLAARKKAAA